MRKQASSLPLWVMALVFLAMVMLFFWPEVEPEKAQHLQGKSIGELSLLSLSRQPVLFTPEINKITILNLWATWCFPCREELPSLQRLADQLDASKYRVVGIAMDEDDHLVSEFLREQKVDYLNMLDVDGVEINTGLNVQALPSTLIINEQGVVVEVITGGREWDSVESLILIEKTAYKQ